MEETGCPFLPFRHFHLFFSESVLGNHSTMLYWYSYTELWTNYRRLHLKGCSRHHIITSKDFIKLLRLFASLRDIAMSPHYPPRGLVQCKDLPCLHHG